MAQSIALPKLVIFDFDGTLFDTHASIAHCISRTFDILTPNSPQPSSESIKATISSGAGLEDAFNILQTELYGQAKHGLSNWIPLYRHIYQEEGLSLIRPFLGAEHVLRFLRERGIEVVVSSNKGVKAIEAVLDLTGLARFISFVAGDVPGIKRKPHVQSFVDLIAPRFEGFQPERVLVVGDTEADILYARNIGAKAMWAKYGYGKQEEVQELGPEYTIGSLWEIEKLFQTA